MSRSDKQQLKPAAGAATDANPKPARRRGWRVFFSVFKWCRVTVLVAVLSVVVLGIFLNRVGIPEWVKRRIQAQMRSVGWEMEFSRMRLRWYRGIVADDLQLERTNALAGPRIFVETAEFRLNLRALRHLDLHADSARIEEGRLYWPLAGTNLTRRTLALNEVQGELVFHRDDHWELRSLEATLLDARVRMRGSVTNASFIREWKLPARRPPKPGESPEEIWNRVFTEARQFQVIGQPEINVIFSLDARDLRSLQASLKLTTLGLNSPWGGGTGVQLSARLLPLLHSNDQVRAEVRFNSDSAQSPWATGTNLQLALTVEPSLTHWLPTNTAVVAQLRDARSRWGRADRALLTVQSQPAQTNAGVRVTRFQLVADQAVTEWGAAQRAEVAVLAHHSSTNLLPVLVESDTQLTQGRTRWATSAWARVSARFALPNREDDFFKTNLTWPARLQNIPVEAITTVSNLLTPGLALAAGTVSNHWQSPSLHSTVEGRSGKSALSIQAGINVETRELTFAVKTRMHPREATPWIPSGAPRWFADFAWQAPLRLEAEGQWRLPEWTNQTPDRFFAQWPEGSLAGRLEFGEGSYRGIGFNAAHTSFQLTNRLWNIAALEFKRPEGSLAVEASGNQDSGDFHLHLHSGIDLKALRPLFSFKNADAVFGMFEFSTPARLDAEVVGNWNELEGVGATAEVSVTNAVFREQSVSSVITKVGYTNRFLSILAPRVLRGSQYGGADGLGIDLAALQLYFTNASGNLPPMVVANAIGDPVVEIVQPYVFDVPPMLRVSGHVPLGRSDGKEYMSFDVLGGSFHWRNIHLERAQALVLWEGKHLTLTNLLGRWHGGEVDGAAHFDFTQPRGGEFSFRTSVRGADLKAVVMDMTGGRTNRIEGTFGGDLTVAQAYCRDLGSWFGYGRAYLRDGLLWDIPIFGVFSQVLNGIVPGMGYSRAKQGSATFMITNSIIHSKDLEISATAMRMQYEGTLDFETRVNARMEAELFRDMPGLGLVISKVLWPVTKLFEYRVTGTISNPKADPIWGIPRVILFPFQPIKTLKDLFGAGNKTVPIPPPSPIEPTAPKAEPPK